MHSSLYLYVGSSIESIPRNEGVASKSKCICIFGGECYIVSLRTVPIYESAYSPTASPEYAGFLPIW